MEFAQNLAEILESGIYERGNHAFSYPETGKAVIFANIGNGRVFQASYTPGNQPSWDCSVVQLTNQELKDHIQTRLSGWNVDKCQFDDIAITLSGQVAEIEEECIEA